MALRIKVSSPDSQPLVRTFDKAEVLIGRKSTNDIILAGKDVSGTHACLQLADGALLVVDLGSLNGTFLNGQQVQSARVAPGDDIMISVYHLAVSLVTGKATPTPTPSRRPTPPPPPVPPKVAAPPPSPPPPAPELADDLPPPIPRRPPAEPRTPAPRTPETRTHAPPISVAPPDDSLPPVIARPGREPATPAPPTVPPLSTEPDDDLPPVLSRPAATPARTPPIEHHSVEPAAASTEPADLPGALSDPTIRRIVVENPQRITVERDGVRLPLARPPGSLDALHDQYARLCGRPFTPAPFRECVLPDGSGFQATSAVEHGAFAVLTRPRGRRGGLDALVQDGALPANAAELLSACVRSRLPVLVVGLAGAPVAPLLAALLGATTGPTAFVRGLPVPSLLPRGCTAFDAGHGSHTMAAATRLALASAAPWLAIDEPEPEALDECAWAIPTGQGVLVGLRATSFTHACQRARIAGTPSAGEPTIPFALVATFESSAENGARTTFSLTQLLELHRDNSGGATPCELVARGRRGEFITTAVPMLLRELHTRGIHLPAEQFSPH